MSLAFVQINIDLVQEYFGNRTLKKKKTRGFLLISPNTKDELHSILDENKLYNHHELKCC